MRALVMTYLSCYGALEIVGVLLLLYTVASTEGRPGVVQHHAEMGGVDIQRYVCVVCIRSTEI